MTAIFCVVLGHIGGITSIPWLVEIIYSFHMALFFAASSYVLAINGRVLSNKKKAQQLLIPYISICMLAITLHGFTVDAIKGYFLSETRWGYWFLPTLWLLFCLIKINMIKLFRSSTFLFIIIAVAIEFFLCLCKLILPPSFVEFFCIRHLVTNWPLFILGYLYHDLHILHGKKILLFSLFVWISVLFLSLALGISNEIIRMCGRFAAVLFFFNTYQRILNVDIAYISYIGIASLKIYIFHYFILQFIPACKMGGIYSLLISLFGSCLIILICCIWHYQVIQRFNILQVLFCGKISLLKSIIDK